MANWLIEGMERIADTGLVTKVQWTVTLVQDMEFANTNGIVEVQASDVFIPYEQLTEQNVLGWVWANISKDEIEADLAKKVTEKINARDKPSVSNDLPW